MNNKNEFKPYVPAERITPEITVTSVVMGIILAVVFGVSNFFVLLFSGIGLKYRLNILLNVLATACWAVASVFFVQFTTACETLAGGIVTDCSLGIGFIVGTVLFFVNVTLNVLVGKSLKKQMQEQPSMEEFIENEIAELRAPKAE